jgi:hypothetical protein
MSKTYIKGYDENLIDNGKSSGLIEYLGYLKENNYDGRTYIQQIRLSVTTIFKTVEGVEKWDNVDIKAIHIDDYFAKFKELTIDKGSWKYHYNNHKSRFKRAIGWYNQFLSDYNEKYGLSTYHMPLNSQKTATLHMPSSITVEDAARLEKFISAFVVEKP